MGYLKEKSSLMMFDRHANLKYKISLKEFIDPFTVSQKTKARNK